MFGIPTKLVGANTELGTWCAVEKGVPYWPPYVANWQWMGKGEEGVDVLSLNSDRGYSSGSGTGTIGGSGTGSTGSTGSGTGTGTGGSTGTSSGSSGTTSSSTGIDLFSYNVSLGTFQLPLIYAIGGLVLLLVLFKKK